MKQKGFTPLEISSTSRKTKFLTGFTLTEVLIAMLLLSLAAAGMFAVFIAGRRFTGGGGRRFEAINFARQTAEHLRDDVGIDDWNSTYSTSPGVPLSVNDPTDPSEVHNEPLPDGDLKDKWSGTRNYRVDWGPTDYEDPQRYKVVTVRVSWNEP